MGHSLIPLAGSTSYVQLIMLIMVESDRYTCVLTGQLWSEIRKTNIGQVMIE